MKYVDVAVFSKTENFDDAFTYCLEKDKLITIGQVVKVPFKNRLLYGVVVKSKAEKPNFSVRPISDILEIIVPTHLIETAFFISNYYFASLSSTLKTMLPQGFYKKRRKLQKSDSKSYELRTTNYKLNNDQKNALQTIKDNQNKKPYLLYGVTGSGKTEIYLKIIEETLKEGLGAIFLVPEIALTPQTISRLEERFPGEVSILHSRLKETEKQTNWNSLLKGEKRIAVGSRSAIFAPIQNLGAIIIDEEHDGSYKQETSPKYDAKKIAEFVAKKNNAKLILGSATPSIETFYKAKKNEYILLQMNKRITQDELPEVRIVDLRQEYKMNNYSPISSELEEEIREVLKTKRKIMLFLNRRGNATYVFCRDCGYVEKCPNCDIPLVHHFTDKENVLKCHHCEVKKNIPLKCPDCSSLAIKYYGLGIQKVESDLKKLFPKSKIIRMDKDTTKERDSHQKIFETFKTDADILLGTQMIAKGFDIPEVDLVGVISADNALNFPDFRANEKSFQLLTQVSGRPGRKESRGKVIIQTFNPENPVLNYVKNHDFLNFYQIDLKERKSYKYPPYSKILRILVKDKDSKKVLTESNRLKDILENWLSKSYNENLIRILGPSPCFLQKLGGNYRWQLILKISPDFKTEDLKKLLKLIGNKAIIDIDPINII